MKGLYLFILTMFLAAAPAVVSAQDANDPFADYSYLWEKDTKKKTKKKKEEDGAPQVTADTVKTDSLPSKKIVQKGPIGIPAPPPDTLRALPDTTRVPASAINTDSLEVPQSATDSLLAADTLNSPYEPAADTTRVPDMPVPTDTVKQKPQPEPVIETPRVEDPEEEETEIDKETKVKKEKSAKEKKGFTLEGEPVKDFRSGSAGGSTGKGSFNGGFTFTVIDDQYYVGMTLQPELNLGKVGVGLNVPILYGLEDQKIRTEMFKDGVGIARLITYIRLGVQKADPIYLRVGQLNNTTIGFGGLVNNYTNLTSFEKRKVGLHYDVNFRSLIGLEGMYSDFDPSSKNLLVFRPYIRPVAWSGIPIVKTFEIGATFLSDKDQTDLTTGAGTSKYLFTREGINAMNLDAGVTLLRVPFIHIDLFANYGRLNVGSQALTDSLNATYTALNEPATMSDGFQDGTGASVGMNFRFHFIADLLSTDVRIERLSYSEHYLPQFFDASYEISKDARIFALGAAEKMSGIYGSLTGHILNKIQLGGSLMIPDQISEATPAVVRVNADLDRLADKFSFHGLYIKGNLTDLTDAFTFDERSLAQLRAIYHVNKFLAAGVDYYWAFTPTETGYKATKYVSPYFGVSIKF